MQVKEKVCSAKGCNRMSDGLFHDKPYCNKHWLRLYNNGTLIKKQRKCTTKYIVKGDIAIGISSRGQHFIIDRSQLGKVSKHSWSQLVATGYLVSNIKGKVTRLNRYLMNMTNSNLVVDHINGNIFDNRLSNLRAITQKNNARNIKLQKNNSYGFTGIRRHVLKDGKISWSARIMVNRSEIRLGTFYTKQEAILARINAEKKYFGKYARAINER